MVQRRTAMHCKNCFRIPMLCITTVVILVLAGCTPPPAPQASAPAGAAAPAAAADTNNPYRPNSLFEVAKTLKAATAGKAAPAGAKFAFLTNNMSPFWTAAQIGVARASSELGVPIAFQAPTAS